jgi:hypothetical protein
MDLITQKSRHVFEAGGILYEASEQNEDVNVARHESGTGRPYCGWSYG